MVKIERNYFHLEVILPPDDSEYVVDSILYIQLKKR